ENLKLLLDIFYNTNINEKSVEEEKGIIGEEIDMYKDQIDSLMYAKLFDNLFNKSYCKHTVVGEREEIAKITAKSLNNVYNDFYVPNNTFIVVAGNFDTEEVMTTIKEYIKKLNQKPKKLPKRLKEKEFETVNIPYEEIKKDMENTRVKYAIKMKKNIFNIKDDNILKDYLGIILSNNFSATSELFERYKDNEIIIGMSYGVNIIDDYLIINVNALTNDGNKFIENIKKDIKKLKLNEEEFERKKKKYLKNYILDFDNIEDVEYLISLSLMTDGKIDYNEYDKLVKLNYKEAVRIMKLINYDNISVIRTIK
ncbi:MAG: insulinase family protein, partial [Bacilli bacterium]